MKMIGFFDFDMTSAVTKGKETPSLSQFRNVEFATQDILNAKPTKLVQRMKKYNQVYILTARSSGCGKMRKAIKNYFMKNGLYIPNKNILMVGDYMQDKKTAEKKAIVLNRFTSINKQVVHFWDDDSDNVEYAKSVKLVKAFQV
jgi:5S rRNA maturation endonuclease (ribonuclease M5)